MDGYILLICFSSTQPVLVWQIWIDMLRFGWDLFIVYFEKKHMASRGGLRRFLNYCSYETARVFVRASA